MMNFMRKAKGSISIFLLLVLMPMVTYATLVIDVSRIQATRTLIMGAGDLTMNASLSEYELALQNMYGLFAQVKNEEDLEKALKQYFTETITGSVSKTEDPDDSDTQYIQDWADALANYITQTEEVNEDDLINFLEMRVVNYSSKPVDGTALANPAIMKKQIIDYMKYKGPISIASNLAEKLSLFGGAAKQTKAIEKKVEYTEELEKLNDPCKEAYKAIMGTEKKKTHAELMAVDMIDKKADEVGYYQYVNRYNASLGGFDCTNWNDDSCGLYYVIHDYVPEDYTYSSQARLAVTNNPIPKDKQWDLNKWIEESKSNTLTSLEINSGYQDLKNTDLDTLKDSYASLIDAKAMADKIVITKKDSTKIGKLEKLIGELSCPGTSVQCDSSVQDNNKNNPTKTNLNEKSAAMKINPAFYKTKSPSDKRIIEIPADNKTKIKDAIQTRYEVQKQYAENINNSDGSNDQLFKLVAYSFFYEEVVAEYDKIYQKVDSQLTEYQTQVEDLAREKAIDKYMSDILACSTPEDVGSNNDYKKIGKVKQYTIGSSTKSITVEEAFYRDCKKTGADINSIKQNFKNNYTADLWTTLLETAKNSFYKSAGEDLFNKAGVTNGVNYARYKDIRDNFYDAIKYKNDVEDSKKDQRLYERYFCRKNKRV